MHSSDPPTGGGGAIRTHRRIEVAAEPDEVWQLLHRVDRYRTWWPWLRSFDAGALAAGEAWRCRIAPPVPWSLRLTVHVVAVEHCRVDAVVSGDVAGTASIVVAPASAGAAITLDAALQASGGATRAVHRLLPALSRSAHDRVIDRAVAQFAERAL